MSPTASGENNAETADGLLPGLLPGLSWERAVQEDGLAVSGGAGGIAFSWDELLEGASRLTRLEEDAQAVRQRVLHIRHLFASSIHGCWFTFFPADARLADAATAVWRAAAECGELAGRLREAFFNYQAAELLATGRFLSLRSVADPAPAPGEARLWTQSVSLDALVTAGATSIVGNLGYTAGVLRSGPVRWQRTGAGVSWTVPRAPSASWWVNRNSAVSRSGRGNIEVLKVQRPDGTVGWAITVPGTQSAENGDQSNPLDESGVAEAMLNDDENFAKQLPDRLREAGARPGDDILLNGHSQGGLHAHALALHPSLTQDFRVKTIITAGSPVARRQTPDSATALNLEVARDAVPQLDGARNADTRNQVTVIFKDRAVPREGAPATSMGVAHSVEKYAAEARRLEDSRDVSVRAALVEVERFAPAGSTLTAITLHGTRGLPSVTQQPSPVSPAPQPGQVPFPNPRPNFAGSPR